MTGNASRFWSATDITTATYGQTTGRNAAWVYDASGNVVQDENRTYKWDAAGRNARAVSIHDASNTLVQGYDGDGQRVRKVETMGTTSVTTLYVTSSALGGRVVSELNGAGEKQTTYVYGAGEVIAKQEVAVGGASSVRWVHQEPVVGSRQETSPTGATLSRTEVDAQGVDVGVSDPYANQVGGHIQPEIPTLLPYDEINGRFGGGGCTLDGMEIGCGRVAQLLDTGAAVRAPEQTVRAVYNPETRRYQGFEFFGAYADGFSGWLGQGERYAGGGRVDQRPYQDANGRVWRGEQRSIDRTPTFINAGFGNQQTGRRNPAVPANLPTIYTRNENDIKCDDKLAALFGGKGAKAATSYDPPGVQNGGGGLRYAGHSAAPYWNGIPSSTDRGGIIHVYGNDTGTATGAALYTPSAGLLRTLPFNQEDDVRGVYNEGIRADYIGGLTIVFSHVEYIGSGEKRKDKARGKTRIGNIGGEGGGGTSGYIHTHIEFFSNHKEKIRVDPRTKFCKEFGF